MKTSPFNPTHPLFPWLILFNVLITTFLALLSATATLIGDQNIQGELALNDPEAQWVSTFYFLGVNSAVPAATWFAERFGYRRIYTLGMLIFAIGSGGSGCAPNFFFLGLSRLIEGIGGGMLFPVGLAMIVRNMPKEKLALALNLYIAVGFGGGLGLGLPICGYFVEFLNWRLIFGGIFALSLVATFSNWLMREREPPAHRPPPFDFFGYGSFILFIASLLTALSFGALASTDGGWTDPFILTCFTIAGLSLFATILIERKHPAPVIPLQLFKDPLFSMSTITLFLLGMSLFSSIGTSADFMLNALKYEKYVTGLIGSAYGISMALASMLASLLIKKIPVPFLILAGLGCLIASYFLNNQITLQSAPPELILILILRGAGVGLSFGPVTGMAMYKVPKEVAGEAATLLTFFRQVGGTYGGTVLSIITIKRTIFHAARYSEQVNPQLPQYWYTWNHLHTKSFSDLSNNGLQSAQEAKLSIAQNIETQAYIQGLNDALLVFGYVAICVGIILSCLIVRSMLHKRKEQKLKNI